MKRFFAALLSLMLIWSSIAAPSASADFVEGSILDMFQDPSYLAGDVYFEELTPECEVNPEPDFSSVPETEYVPELAPMPELEIQDEAMPDCFENEAEAEQETETEAEPEIETEAELDELVEELPEDASRYSIVPHNFLLRDIYERCYYGKSLTFAEAMNLMADELSEAITRVVESVEVDEVLVRYNGAFEGTYRNMMTELAAVFCVGEGWFSPETLMFEKLSAEQVNRLHKIYWSMLSVEPLLREELSYSFAEDGSELIESVYSCLQMDVSICRAAEYLAENAEQLSAVEVMLSEEGRAALYDLCMGRIAVSDARIDEIISKLPEDLSESRKAVVEQACSLVGKVPYFWGGKSDFLGWDTRWNVPRFVNSSGSDTLGMAKPYGLDCSGYIGWVFINSAGSEEVLSLIGQGTVSQFNNCVVISEELVQPGDLVFSIGDGVTPNHAGIVVGRTDSGEVLLAHCTANGSGGVVIEPVSSSGCTIYASPVQFYNEY